MLPSALGLALAVAVQAPAAPASAAAPPGRFRLIRSTSGSRGIQDGQRFVIQDPRTVFHAGQDRQVLVLFEWQGPSGTHRCEGTWKDPGGKAALTSQSELVARGPRFGVYWGLSLPDAVATGTWLLEARVDGEPAGVHAFQILSDEPGADTPPARRALTVAEIYQRGLAATLVATALDAAGRPAHTTSGLLLAPDRMLVPFAMLNGARVVRVALPDGRQLETAELAAWNRREQWAILRLPEPAGPPAPRAARVPAVGDPCYFVEAQGDGARVIVESSVVGRATNGDLVVSQHAGEASSGAPVLDEHGEAVGFLLSPLPLAGADRLDLHALGPDPAAGAVWGERVRALPALPAADVPLKTLADLERAGEFVRPLAKTTHFVHAVLGTGVAKERGIPFALDQRSRFSHGDAGCVVFVTWTPRDKQDAIGDIVLFDDANRPLFKSPPEKLKLRRGATLVQWWPIDLARLQAGIYRVDVRLDGAPVQRSFFRLVD